MYDVITIGSISVDLYFKGKTLTHDDGRFHLAVGGKYLADDFYVSLGGGAANVAIGCIRHGLKTGLLGKIGNNAFREMIYARCKAEGLSTELCENVEDYYKISSVLLSETGERTIVNYQSPHEHILGERESILALSRAKCVYMSNIPRVDLNERCDCLRYLKTKGVLTVLNMGSDDCRKSKDSISELVSSTDILITNSHEMADLLKIPHDQIDWSADVTSHFEILKSRIVVVTHGEGGSYSYAGGEVFFQPVEKNVSVVDTTGAGDAYSAGFMSGYILTKNIPEAMKMGSAYSATIIAKLGAN